MEQRRSSTTRERVPVPAQARKNAYQHQEDPPRLYGKAPATSGEEMSYIPARSNSHRRRDSQLYYAPKELPTAPEVPRGGPPVSYKESSDLPSASTSVRRRSDPRSYSSRVGAQPLTVDTSGRRHQNPPFESVSKDGQPSTMPSASRNDRPVHDGSIVRRGSVPERSPLQKLEGTLGDISKEEKRARIAEAELCAKEKSDARKRRSIQATRDALERTSVIEDTEFQPFQSDKPRRAVTMPMRGPTDPEASGPQDESLARHRDQTVLPPPKRSQTQRTVSGPNPQRPQTERQPALGDPYAPMPRKAVPSQSRQGPSHSDYERRASRTSQHAAMAAAAAGATGLGLYASHGSPDEYNAHESPNVTVSRSGSRRLQKQPPRPDSYLPQGPPRGPVAYPPSQTRGYTPGYGPPQPAPQPLMDSARAAPIHQGSVSRPRDGPMPAPVAPAENIAHPRGGGQHYHGFFHRHGEPDRRYQKTPVPSEFRKGGIATLMSEDFRLDKVAPVAPEDDSAWWEKSAGSQRRRHSGRVAAAPHDAYAEGRERASERTLFNPPLYLKCGPLLRYCGIDRQKTTIQHGETVEHETWRGSIMIVTIDNQSDTTAPPTLRLFSSPAELLPPPPTHLDAANGQQLAPEYVDPIAGAVKGSRIGKTLYVRPVEYLPEGVDLSRVEDDSGLFEENPSPPSRGRASAGTAQPKARTRTQDGEQAGKFREVKGFRLHAERGVTFWRFNIAVELGPKAARVAYRINRGPAIPFWVPARRESMNIMFHSCNGFSLSVNTPEFGGPDPLWRDVLNSHTLRPFHVMVGGGDQIYNDRVTQETELFGAWCEIKRPGAKEDLPFTEDMQDELEEYYLNRYAMWFSQGLFGMAAGMIPMVNIWDDHDIIDGFGSYPDHFMRCPVFSGVGNVAFKYYMLFQHQSVPEEMETHEPSWILGAEPGPYIQERSRSLYMSFGKQIAFLGLDCRTERMRDSVLTQETYDLIFERLEKEVIQGETKHLLVLLGVPIAYPRLNFLENVLTSRVMDPIKALGRTGKLGNFVNKFDGGVEILDDLDDHWTAKHHKYERNWLIQELQEFAAEFSVRVTILGGDVHLAGVGQFYTNKKLGVAKDKDHRYMPNVISSAIVNTPPPDLVADVLNRRNKVHHLDPETDEDMIPMFLHDSDGKPRNNKTLLPRRNWCAIRAYQPGSTPPPTPPLKDSPDPSYSTSRGRSESRGRSKTRSMSLTRSASSLIRRLSRSRKRDPEDQPPFSPSEKPSRGAAPPRSFFNRHGDGRPEHQRSFSAEQIPARPSETSGSYFEDDDPSFRPGPFLRRPTDLSEKGAKLSRRNSLGRRNSLARRDSHPFTNHGGLSLGSLDAGSPDDHINLEGGLDITLNVEVSRGDPAGITHPYRLLVPSLFYSGAPDINPATREGKLKTIFGGFGRSRDAHSRTSVHDEGRGPYEPHDTALPAISQGNVSEGYGRERYGEDDVLEAERAPKQKGMGGLFRSLTGRFGSKRGKHPGPYTPAEREGDEYSFEDERAGEVQRRMDEYHASRRQSTAVRDEGPREAPPGGVRLGPDGRPIRKVFRGGQYDDDLEDAEDDELETPRLGEVSGVYGPDSFYGKERYEGETIRKKPVWKVR